MGASGGTCYFNYVPELGGLSINQAVPRMAAAFLSM